MNHVRSCIPAVAVTICMALGVHGALAEESTAKAPAKAPSAAYVV